jgi:two-component system chemotaxis response regulator CheB
VARGNRPESIVIVGSSTGGPKVLERVVFRGLPRLNAPLVLIQHMPTTINQVFTDHLDRLMDMDVKLAEDGEPLRDGTVYVAPSERHLSLVANRRVGLSNGMKVNYVCPSIDVAMLSLKAMPELKTVGVLLTGMGRDGAAGMRHIKGIGGMTIAQDKASCDIYGMPKAAIDAGIVDLVLTPQEIRDKLVELVGVLQ